MIREMNHIDQLRGQLRRRVSPPFGTFYFKSRSRKNGWLFNSS